MSKSRILLTTALLAAFATLSYAGPVRDFETEARTAYATYRAALFETNKKDKANTEAAIAKFAGQWSALQAKWSKSPPPQYTDDQEFAPTLDRVAAINNKAAQEAGKGELAEAHEVLEKIRDELSSLRARNNVAIFSDRMNAYHEMMEVVLTRDYTGFDAKGLGQLREDAGALAHLSAELGKMPPSDAPKEAYQAAYEGVKGAVDKLLAAARAGDAEAAKKAVQSLKQPYALMFLKFG